MPRAGNELVCQVALGDLQLALQAHIGHLYLPLGTGETLQDRTRDQLGDILNRHLRGVRWIGGTGRNAATDDEADQGEQANR